MREDDAAPVPKISPLPPAGGPPRGVDRGGAVPNNGPQGGDNSVDAGDNPSVVTDGAVGDDAGPPGRGDDAPRGIDLARRALEQARAAAKERGVAVGRGRASPRRAPERASRSNRRRWSGPGADDRDPQTFASLAAGLVRTRGWSEDIAAGAVLGRWNTLVGADIADHAQPESLVGGELVVRAESTAWASQLRTLQRQILAKIAAGVGHGVVTRLTVRGPAAPSWKHGERTVRGRGPRDTYG